MPDHIKAESSPEDWICLCGNRPHHGGFYPCDEKGNEVEPDSRWSGRLYVCADCGRIIDQTTREVMPTRANVG